LEATEKFLPWVGLSYVKALPWTNRHDLQASGAVSVIHSVSS
jgi:hypothetical protein